MTAFPIIDNARVTECRKLMHCSVELSAEGRDRFLQSMLTEPCNFGYLAMITSKAYLPCC